MINPQVIGPNIAFLRKSHQLTQQELAEKINITHQAVSKWERGESLPDLSSLYHLSVVFRTSIDDMVKQELNPSNTDIDLSPITSENVNEIWEQALEQFQRTYPKPNYDTWFKYTSAVYENGQFKICCTNEFSKNWLQQKYGADISIVLNHITGNTTLDITYEVTDRPYYSLV